jgi:regulator of protease activity HflC (stomatin/prohibitin superfamily)
MIRAMAKQAEAERERRAKIIHAEGEMEASNQLARAAKRMSEESGAMTLRYLQTLLQIGVEHNTTIIFPVPIDLFEAFRKNNEGDDADK